MFGINWSDPETFWLNMTNAGLGLIVFACVLLIAYNAVRDIRAKRARRGIPVLDEHGAWIADLGWTAADGGEKVEQKQENPF